MNFYEIPAEIIFFEINKLFTFFKMLTLVINYYL